MRKATMVILALVILMALVLVPVSVEAHERTSYISVQLNPRQPIGDLLTCVPDDLLVFNVATLKDVSIKGMNFVVFTPAGVTFREFRLCSNGSQVGMTVRARKGLVSFTGLDYSIPKYTQTIFSLRGIPQGEGGPVVIKLRAIDIRTGYCKLPVSGIVSITRTTKVVDTEIRALLSASSPSGEFPGGYRELARYELVKNGSSATSGKLTVRPVVMGPAMDLSAFGRIDLYVIGVPTPVASTFLADGEAIFVLPQDSPILLQDYVTTIYIRGYVTGSCIFRFDLVVVEAVSDASDTAIAVQGLPVYGSTIQII